MPGRPNRPETRPGWPTQPTSVAVLVPCYNEETAIATVVADFREALPEAAIYVYDNNSRDRTVEVARPPAPSSAASRIKAKATWCAACLPTSRRTSTCWSMATPPTTPERPRHDRAHDRRPSRHGGGRAGRPGDRRPIGPAIASAIGCSPASSPTCSATTFTDILSGYRVFSRRFVKSFPVLSRRVRDRDRA